MTTEQLEELIEQNGTVYDKDCFEIQLYSKDKCKILPKHDGENDYLLVHYVNAFRYFPISQLMDKEHFEWYCKTLGERTERFEPPMWEDIEDYYDFRFIVKNKCIRLYVRKSADCIAIFTEDDNRVFESDSNKESYIEVCEIVRDLFNKEKNYD